MKRGHGHGLLSGRCSPCSVVRRSFSVFSGVWNEIDSPFERGCCVCTSMLEELYGRRVMPPEESPSVERFHSCVLSLREAVDRYWGLLHGQGDANDGARLMPVSAEHVFIAEAFDEVLNRFSATALFGLSEAERRRFDYACLLLRDLSRAVVSQVLWRHEKGIDKDLRMLLHERDAAIKVYFVRDSLSARARIDEIMLDYSRRDETRPLLRGLKLIFCPSDFDADRSKHTDFMNRFLLDIVMRDLLFGVVFGRLNRHDFETFLNHGGPLGLKFAVLDEITKHGLDHGPTFRDRLGYRTSSPIREATTMLAATGLVRRVGSSILLMPSLKGRMLLDLTRLMLIEYDSCDDWSPEVKLILRHLGTPAERPVSAHERSDPPTNGVGRLIEAAKYCELQFDRNLLAGVDFENPKLYSTFEWREFYERIRGAPGVTARWFDDEESLFFVDTEERE